MGFIDWIEVGDAELDGTVYFLWSEPPDAAPFAFVGEFRDRAWHCSHSRIRRENVTHFADLNGPLSYQ